MTTKTTKSAKAAQAPTSETNAVSNTLIAAAADHRLADSIDMNDPGFRFERVEADALKSQ